MRPTVRAAFLGFTKPLEGGVLSYMYADSLGNVTTGVGNKIDDGTAAPALALAWTLPDGSAATPAEISSEWQLVKSSYPKIQSYACKAITQLRLSAASLSSLYLNTLTGMDAALTARYPGYAAWPADAQLAVLSMAWAMGAAFAFPKFDAAVNASPPDFAAAALESHCSNCAAARNDANLFLLQNADTVTKGHLDPAVLWYPSSAGPGRSPPLSSKVDATLAVVALVTLLAGGLAIRHASSRRQVA